MYTGLTRPVNLSHKWVLMGPEILKTIGPTKTPKLDLQGTAIKSDLEIGKIWETDPSKATVIYIYLSFRVLFVCVHTTTVTKKI